MRTGRGEENFDVRGSKSQKDGENCPVDCDLQDDEMGTCTMREMNKKLLQNFGRKSLKERDRLVT